MLDEKIYLIAESEGKFDCDGWKRKVDPHRIFNDFYCSPKNGETTPENSKKENLLSGGVIAAIVIVVIVVVGVVVFLLVYFLVIKKKI